MEWIVCFIISTLLLMLAFCVLIRNVFNKKQYNLSELKFSLMLFIGSSLSMFFPMYLNIFDNSSLRILKTLLLSIHNTIRLFVVDGDFEIVLQTTNDITGAFKGVYQLLVSIVFCLAPLFTFSVVLSFFNNIKSSIEFWLIRKKDIYVFSELTEQSITLARDLSNKGVIVFTSSKSKNNAENEYLKDIKEIGAIYFDKPITSVDFGKKSKRIKLIFTILEDDEDSAVQKSLRLIEKYKYRDNTEMYIFVKRIDSEIVLSNAVEDAVMKVHRVNSVDSLTNDFLNTNGFSLFDNAKKISDDEKKISAVIVGLGEYGKSLLKALSWYCQMPGYSIYVDAFDADPLAKDKFAAICPELIDENINGKKRPNECQYTINIHSGVDVNTIQFVDSIKNLKDTTIVFVSLGSDELNIEASMNIRMLLSRINNNAPIYSVVYNKEKSKALDGIHNFKGQKYNINFIGSIEDRFCEKVVMNSEIDNEAMQVNLSYEKNPNLTPEEQKRVYEQSENSFWRYQYNHDSSVASALHTKAKKHCNIRGVLDDTNELSKEDELLLADCEHKRWWAWMRSQGYVYSGSPNASTRNDLAKMHHNMTTQLSDEDLYKDVRVVNKK